MVVTARRENSRSGDFHDDDNRLVSGSLAKPVALPLAPCACAWGNEESTDARPEPNMLFILPIILLCNS